MVHCWAHTLGNCSDKQSGEHLVTAGFWPGPKVQVRGFDWCKDESKLIGLNSAKSNILCTTHNSLLSPVDQAGIEAFNAFRTFSRLTGERKRKAPKRRRPTRLEADGPTLERWFLKTALNVISLSKSASKWRLTGAPLPDIPPLLVAQAYGKVAIEQPMGLYAIAAPGALIGFTDAVAVAPLIWEEPDFVVGFLFAFYGFRFLYNCGNVWLPNPLLLPKNPDPMWKSNQLTYRLGFVTQRTGRFPSHYLSFNWPNTPPPAWAWQT